MKIKGILLDKDGTLIDFFSLWGEAACKVTERVIDEYHLGQLPQARGCLLDSLGIKDGLADPEGALAWKSYSMIADDVYCALENQMKKHSFSPCTKFCRENLEKTLVREFTEETCTKVTEFKTFTDLKKLMSALAEKGIKPVWAWRRLTRLAPQRTVAKNSGFMIRFRFGRQTGRSTP